MGTTEALSPASKALATSTKLRATGKGGSRRAGEAEEEGRGETSGGEGGARSTEVRKAAQGQPRERRLKVRRSAAAEVGTAEGFGRRGGCAGGQARAWRLKAWE